MRISLTTVLAAVAVAVVTTTAPAAQASPDRTSCSERRGSSVCQKPGHTSLHTEPRGPNINLPPGSLFRPGWTPGFGRGLMPPLAGVD